MKDKEWYSQLHWIKNPFTLEINPSLFVGYDKEIEAIVNHIDEGHKYILLTGPTGSGKTTLLKWLQQRYNVVYLSKPPLDEEGLVSAFKSSILKPSIFDILFRRIVNIYNLTERINQKNKGRKLIFLIDEAHETNIAMLEWFRTINDQVDGATLILAGLPKLKKEYLKELETLKQRITLDIELLSLNKDETVLLIKNRIFAVGGKSIEPFTTDAFNEIYTRTGGFPREVIKQCDVAIHQAIKRNSTLIDSSYFSDQTNVNVNIAENMKLSLNELTNKQHKIIDLITKNEGITPSQIAEIIGFKEYGSKSHALRAMNNILTRLMKNHLLTRERKGRTYVYQISPKLKNLLITS